MPSQLGRSHKYVVKSVRRYKKKNHNKENKDDKIGGTGCRYGRSSLDQNDYEDKLQNPCLYQWPYDIPGSTRTERTYEAVPTQWVVRHPNQVMESVGSDSKTLCGPRVYVHDRTRWQSSKKKTKTRNNARQYKQDNLLVSCEVSDRECWDDTGESGPRSAPSNTYSGRAPHYRGESSPGSINPEMSGIMRNE